ncbi:MAG: hypothetical protein ICV53_19030 [Flavisolibacter sp.]|nr:hypothetical protein [Flavisolibacter sp.]
MENEAFLFTRIRTAFLFGVLFFCGIMNIFFFSIVRERVYLYYALFVLFYGLNNASHNIALIFFKEHWDFVFIWGWSSNYLYFFFLVQFIRHFLKTPVNYPKWDRYLFSLGILQAIMGIPAFFIEPSLSGKWNGLTTDVTYLLWGLIHLSILTTFFYFIREQNKSIRLLIIAALPAFCIWGLEYIVVEAYNVLNFRLNVPFPGFIQWLRTWYVVLQLICVCWFAIIFSWVLFQYFSMLRRQLTQQSEELKSVFEKEILKTQLEIQEQTLHNISEELHDNIGQKLILTKLNISNIDVDINDTARKKLSESKGLLTEAIQDLRDLSKTFNSNFINEMGLVGAIEQQIHILNRTGLYKTELCVKGEVYFLDPKRELITFRIVQELLNNIIKHAEATEISIRMDYLEDPIIVKVQDNGKGFNIEEQQLSDGGLGLINVQNRIQLIGGHVLFESMLQNGTIVILELPK